MGTRFGIVAVTFWLLGCGAQESGDASSGGAGSGGQSSADSGLGGSLGGGQDADTNAGYPSGPYGTQPGDVLANLELVGYLRHDTTGLAYAAELGPISFESIRQSTDKTHALIHVSGFT